VYECGIDGIEDATRQRAAHKSDRNRSNSSGGNGRAARNCISTGGFASAAAHASGLTCRAPASFVHSI
jgi:hypothetical protein